MSPGGTLSRCTVCKRTLDGKAGVGTPGVCGRRVGGPEERTDSRDRRRTTSDDTQTRSFGSNSGEVERDPSRPCVPKTPIWLLFPGRSPCDTTPVSRTLSVGKHLETRPSPRTLVKELSSQTHTPAGTSSGLGRDSDLVAPGKRRGQDDTEMVSRRRGPRGGTQVTTTDS